MLNLKIEHLSERLKCFVRHDWSNWKHSTIYLGKQKVRNCKRGGCPESEVVYQYE
jgi:hypothetical protein